MKYLKKYNEKIDWDQFDDEDENPIKEIPYIKNGITYGKYYSLNNKKNNVFNLEDKIIYIGSQYNIKNKIGEIVDIVDDNDFEVYLIYFYDNVNGHKDCNIPRGHGWWVNYEDIKKI